MSLLHVQDVSVRYGGITALRGVNLKIAAGETVFVTGPNGAGKSTLLRAMAGVTPVSAGAITVNGNAVSEIAPEYVARLGVSMVPEGRHVFGSLSVEENLRVGAGMRHDRDEVERDLQALLHEFPVLMQRRHSQAGLLSGGQQQMLVIARALMTRPALLAIDEPSLGLAPKVIDQVYEALIRLRDQNGLTLLIVEQSSTRALIVGGRIMMLRSGQVVLEGNSRDLRGDEMQRAYFGFDSH
jgi:branched-chain amino acid transport system ATP-binding protein